MAREVTADRKAAGSTSAVLVVPAVAAASAAGRPFVRIAFSAWAAAFAVGALIHSWQGAQSPWSIGTVVAVAAVAVILRPTSPARLVVLFGVLVVETFIDLPDLVNHLIVVGVLGSTFVGWWLVLSWRSPEQAHDPGVLYERVAPYLRVAFIMTFAFAAVAKFNTGFTDVATTCSVWILESIPGVRVPLALAPLVIAGTMALELAVPALLMFHRTRPFAVILGFGFHLVSAFAGHASFSGFAWSFYLLFLPPAVIARAVVVARRGLPDRVRTGIAVAVARTPLTLAVFAVAWVAGVGAVLLAPGSLHWRIHWMSAALICTVWMVGCGWLLVTLRRHWLGAPGPRASLRVRNGVMLLGLGLLVVTAATPYLGLKSRGAFTMFSNVRTEPGHWNHLFIPESVRVFGWQDGEVQFLDTDDPALAAAIDDHAGSNRTVALEARRLVGDFPDATVRYELDGVGRVAAPVSTDPVLGQPVSPAQEWFGAMRPFTDSGQCQH
ncbi:MAG: hypothetical protein ACRDRH_03430 [Pseudonocardia sp.]